MRTTLTLDPDVAERIRQELSQGKGLKAIVNSALRLGLGLASQPAVRAPFQVRAYSFDFHPGIDLDRMNQLVDELESHEAVRKLQS